MFGLGTGEVILIIVAILLLFGAKRLPEVAQGLGKGVREFRKAMKDTSDELKGNSEEKKPTGNTPSGTESR
jgi:TatA/E family protein of Tat protein translocase